MEPITGVDNAVHVSLPSSVLREEEACRAGKHCTSFNALAWVGLAEAHFVIGIYRVKILGESLIPPRSFSWSRMIEGGY